jgi:hypothetical protein
MTPFWQFVAVAMFFGGFSDVLAALDAKHGSSFACACVAAVFAVKALMVLG